MLHNLAQALTLADCAVGLSNPNPAVGCVLTTAEGALIGQGHTQKAGGPHAEIMALRDAQSQGNSVVGATAYVTLEPCSHHGRTGPCCDALIAAGIGKVVATNADPNPLVAGQGFARLRAAGVVVEVLEPDDALAQQSRALNIGFFSRMVRKTPWVRMKIAATLDGKTALNNGSSQWITTPAARADGHAWRARSCAVLTGIGTLLADSPRLDVRLVPTQRQPHVVIVDSCLRTPLDAPALIAGRAAFIYAAALNDEKKHALQARGAKVLCLPDRHIDGEPTGKVDLHAMLLDLGQREINALHVEAGEQLNGALLRANLVDELLVYLAPKLVGQGRDMASLGPLEHLEQALQMEFTSVDRIGQDLRVVARIIGRDVF
ncbi:MAG: bifunctional diaminohydroxyphosphoribosylaminopyrimidine deaminase/5-amino-6-(5-phosphoribosylamino)uracil reductase RibD [Rhodoferax sp.]|nr:bifunctional diaminohydroxyphosphoribosylaminopyrimidine deaminase/5-amino-6-(5-phosphoribosylamino)uracil reductase RibD [Rhodoferax sp.]